MSLAIAGYFPNLPPIPFIGEAYQPPPPPRQAPKPRRAHGELLRDWRGVHGNVLVYGYADRVDSLGRKRFLEFECLLCKARGTVRVDGFACRQSLDDGCGRCARRVGRIRAARARRDSAVAAAVANLKTTNAARRVAR